MFLVYNSDVLSADDFNPSVSDRAFQYGDGLFETIRYENGKVWFWTDHFDRLSRGMAALYLNPPVGFSPDTLYQSLIQLLSANGLANQAARIKIQVWRRAGGFYTPTTNDANLLLITRPGSPFAVTERPKIAIYTGIRLSPSAISFVKTLNALPYVLAGMHKQTQGYDEVILLDSAGHVAECTASNLFWYHDQTLFTPSLQTGCIDGIARRQLLRLAPTLGMSVQEGFYQPDELTQADSVFCANALGIQWFRQLQKNDSTDYAALPPGGHEPLSSLFAQFHR